LIPKGFTEDQIRAEVKKLIAEIIELEPEEISDTALFAEDLGVDSLAGMEVMVTVDKRFKIDIPEEEFVKLKNVNDVVEMVRRFMPQAEASASSGA
jgi:acyl carrier protein